MPNNQTIIATAGLVSVGVGSANSIFKYKRAPSSRFLIGSGVAFFLLSAMAASESLGEIAKGLALGVMSTILLGEGGGVMSYFAGEHETNTKAPAASNPDTAQRDSVQTPARASVRIIAPAGAYHPNIIAPQPFQPFHP